jgi:hypothetical protein
MKIKFVLVIALVAVFAPSAMTAPAQEKKAIIAKEDIESFIRNAEELETILPRLESDVNSLKTFMDMHGNEDQRDDYYNMLIGIRDMKIDAEVATVFGVILRNILERESGNKYAYKIPGKAYRNFKRTSRDIENKLKSIRISCELIRQLKYKIELGPAVAPQ